MTARIASGLLRALVGAWLLAALPACAPAVVEIKILATDPAPDALLARQQSFFVRFEAKSSAPIAVSVSGWFKGSPVIDNGGSGPPARLAGGGIGVVSFFYWGDVPTRIDEVRLQVTDARSGANLAEHAFPVALTWLSDDAAPREPAAWVKDWKQATPASARDAAPQHGTYRWLALAAIVIAVAGLAAARWRRRRAQTPIDDAERRE